MLLYLSNASAQIHHCACGRGRNGQMARSFDSRGAYRGRSFDQCTPVLSNSFPCYLVLVGACLNVSGPGHALNFLYFILFFFGVLGIPSKDFSKKIQKFVIF